MIFAIIVIVLILLDQISKFAAVKYLKPIGNFTVIEGILDFTYVENRGAAFGIMQNHRWIFITVTLIITIALIIYKIKSRPKDKVLNTSLCLIISGALGNLIDRIFRGYVVDMLEVTFIEYPVFNVADCFVVTGAILLSIYILFFYKEPEKEMKKNDQI